MTQQNINVGSQANDGTGDNLRSAFTKANSNFTEVYNSLIPSDNTGVAEGDSLVWNSDTNQYEPKLVTGGLSQQGTLPALVTEQGIYVAEGTNSSVTLYPATASQDRVMISSTAAGVGTVITAPIDLGVDITYTTQSDGELLLFVDAEAGKWTVQVVGASQQTGLHYVSASVTDTSGNFIVVPVNSGPLDVDNANLTILDPNGLVDGATNSIKIKNDGLYEIQFTGGINATGAGVVFRINVNGVVVATSITENESFGVPFGVVSTIQNLVAGDEITFTNELNGDYQRPSYTVKQLPATESVLAGMVTPEKLVTFSLTPLVINAALSDTGGVNGKIRWQGFSPGHYRLDNPDNLIDSDLTTLNLPEGRYEVIMSQVERNNVLLELGIFLNGVELVHSNTPVSTPENTTSRGTVPVIFDVPAGGGELYVIKQAVSTLNIVDFAFTLKQLPTATVVNLGVLDSAMITPENLHYVSLSSNGAEGIGFSVQTTVIGAGYVSLDLDDTDFTNVIDSNNLINPTRNSITIKNAGLYEILFSTGENNGSITSPRIRKNGAVIAGAYKGGPSAQDNTSSFVIADLAVGDEIEFTHADGTSQDMLNVMITVKQLPTSAVVMPDALDVEDLGLTTIKQFENTTEINLTSSRVAYNISNGFDLTDCDYIEITLSDDGTTTGSYLWTGLVDIQQFINDSRNEYLVARPGSGFIILDKSGSSDLSNGIIRIQDAGSVAQRIQKVVGVKYKTIKTVINTTDTPVNDQSTSGYMDIGNMRIQWGREISTADLAQTINFPVAFKALPALTVSVDLGSGDNSAIEKGAFSSPTTTGFAYNRDDSISNADNAYINWQAIGEKV